MLRRLRFSLRTLHASLLVFALVLALFVVPGVRQSRCSAVLLDSGAIVSYGKPAAPKWLVGLVGHDFVQPITGVSFVFARDWQRTDSILAQSPISARVVESPERLLPVLRQLPDLQCVTVSTTYPQSTIEQFHRELPDVAIVVVSVSSGVEVAGSR